MNIKEISSIKKDFSDCALNLTQTTAEKMRGKLFFLKAIFFLSNCISVIINK